LISSGTIASLTGFNRYEDVDRFQERFVYFVENSVKRYDSWQDAWHDFEKSASYKSLIPKGRGGVAFKNHIPPVSSVNPAQIKYRGKPYYLHSVMINYDPSVVDREANRWRKEGYSVRQIRKGQRGSVSTALYLHYKEDG